MLGKKVLILGGSSYVGKYLFSRLGTDKAIATYCKTPIAGGIYFDSLTMKISGILESPDKISHAIILLGDTNPETCAEDAEKSNALNVDSIKSILKELKKLKIKPVFTSSEFIYDGKKGNYDENDPPNPILLYGMQKLKIEKFIQDNFNDFIILRLAKVYGSDKGDKKLIMDWLKSIKNNKTISCASDQRFSPIYIEDVVKAIIKIVGKNPNGIFNLGSEKSYSRLEILNILINSIRIFSQIKINITARSIHDFDLKEKRPLDISMNSAKIVNEIGIKLTPVEIVCKNIARKNFGGEENGKNIINRVE